jgi:hypothetical protein
MIISQIEIKLPLLYFNEEDENRERKEKKTKSFQYLLSKTQWDT